MNKYPKYKPSNIPWLGDVPEHWEIVSNRRLFFERKEYNDEEEAELLSVSQYTGVTKKQEATVKTGMHDAESLVGYRIVRKGDFVMNYMLAWNGSMGISQYDGVTSPAYAVFRIKEGINKWYLHYLMRTPFMNQYFEAFSTGMVKSRLRLYPDSFKSLCSFIPPLAEQTQIVQYLDEKLQKINKLTDAKKQQINLLKEQKQAMINEAVAASDNCIKCKLKNLATFKSGTNLTSLEIEPIGEYPVYGGNGLRGYYPEFSHNGEYLLIGRQGALCGNVHYVNEKFWATEHAVTVKCNENVNTKWLYYLLIYMNLNQYSMAAAQPGLSVEYVVNLPAHFPSFNVQLSIANYLDGQCVKIDLAIAKIEREISLLGDYRTRLISDVVTGKIDVRELKALDYDVVERKQQSKCYDNSFEFKMEE